MLTDSMGFFLAPFPNKTKGILRHPPRHVLQSQSSKLQQFYGLNFNFSTTTKTLHNSLKPEH